MNVLNNIPAWSQTWVRGREIYRLILKLLKQINPLVKYIVH